MASVVSYIEGLGFAAFLDRVQFSATLPRARLAMLPHLLVLPQRVLRMSGILRGRHGGYGTSPLYGMFPWGPVQPSLRLQNPIVLIRLPLALEVPTLLLLCLLRGMHPQATCHAALTSELQHGWEFHVLRPR